MAINLFNKDCMEGMKEFPDQYFDLAITDIPYGIDVANMPFIKEKKTTVKQRNGNRINSRTKNSGYISKDWDQQTPTQEYFDELKRVSKDQIIFGVEYVDWSGLGEGRIKWNKGVAEGMSFKPYELAYCSIINEEIEIDLLWSGMMQAKSLSDPMTQQGNKKLNEKRIHPTQKPILLYKKLLIDYASIGYRILDTHRGSDSLAIACYDMEYDFTGFEIDSYYHELGKKRFINYSKQLKIAF